MQLLPTAPMLSLGRLQTSLVYSQPLPWCRMPVADQGGISLASAVSITRWLGLTSTWSSCAEHAIILRPFTLICGTCL
jgi:hypothetical protein